MTFQPGNKFWKNPKAIASRFKSGENHWSGHHHTEKTKQILREKHLGKPLSEEHKKAISDANKGRPNTGQFKRGVSSWRLGKGKPLEGDSECLICHKPFHWKRAAYNDSPKTCSKECRYKLVSIVEFKRIKRICIVCKKVFFIPLAWLRKNRGNDGTYCSKDCKNSRTIRYSKDDKRWAGLLVHSMIKQGTLIPQPCEVCGTTIDVQAHHYKGYKKEDWLNVKWYCHLHHAGEHARLRQTGESILL
jgi:hypothetical protein